MNQDRIDFVRQEVQEVYTLANKLYKVSRIDAPVLADIACEIHAKLINIEYVLDRVETESLTGVFSDKTR